MPSGRWVWIEVAYLYPRFWRQEQRSRAVGRWLRERAVELFGTDAARVGWSFFGDPNHPAGPIRRLPPEHTRDAFLSDAEVVEFFRLATDFPRAKQEVRLTNYTLTLTALPAGSGQVAIVGGIVQEQSRTTEQHAVFRVLRHKGRQHEVAGPRLVCVGSDVSPALSRINDKVPHAVSASFRTSRELTGAIVVRIENSIGFRVGHSTMAHAGAYVNASARNPLSKDEWKFLGRLNFNHWKLHFSALEQDEPSYKDHQRLVGGPLSVSGGGRTRLKITVPSPALMDALAGRRALLDSYPGWGEDIVAKCLKEGWAIVGCSFQPGNLEQSLAASVVLELVPPHEPVYWPPKGVQG
jgi:hypothetical protein